MPDTRPISWVKAARKDFESFLKKVQTEALTALTIAAEGARRRRNATLISFVSG
jgi:hypothetical protein